MPFLPPNRQLVVTAALVTIHQQAARDRGQSMSSTIAPVPDLCVGEEEHGVLVLNSGHVVEFLEIIVEGRVVIASTQLNLETLAIAHVRAQPELTHASSKLIGD